MWRNWSPHTLLVGMSNGAAAVENSFAATQNVNIVIIRASNFTPREMKTCPHKNIYTKIHSSIIHNSQKVKTTQISN